MRKTTDNPEASGFDRIVHRLANLFSPDRLRAYPPTMAICVLLVWAATMALGDGLTDRNKVIIGGDFSSFYMGGRYLLEGRLNELYDFVGQKDFQDALVAPAQPDDTHPFVNPPFTTILYAPFALTGYVTGLFTWMGFGLIMLLVSLRMLRNELFDADRLSVGRMLVLTLLFYPTLAWLMYSQNSTITLLLLTTTFLMMRRGKDLSAGLTLGLLFYKPQLMLAAGMMLLVSRRWRALGGVTLGVAIWTGVGLLIGSEAMIEYFKLSPRLFEFLRADGSFMGIPFQYPRWGSQSFYGFCILLFDGFSQRLTNTVATLLTVGGVLAVGAAWLRTPWEPGSRQWDLTAAATLALGVLISPHLFVYDLTLLLLPLFIVYSKYPSRSTGLAFDGGPLLAATGTLYVLTFVSSYLARGQLLLSEWADAPKTALQFSTPAIVLWSWVVYRCSRLADSVIGGDGARTRRGPAPSPSTPA